MTSSRRKAESSADKSKPGPTPLKETDLYHPLKYWLETQGYRVRGEVGHCDIAAEKDGELIAVELKLRASLNLLAQAAERQEFADAVYVALPVDPSTRRAPAPRSFRRLLRRLGIGLVLVRFLKTKTTVEPALHPGPMDRAARRRPKKKAAILREIAGRDLDLTPGGQSGRLRRVSSHRQKSIRLAVWLSVLGEASPNQLVKLGAPDDAGRILAANVYGWYERVRRGVYTLHPAGRSAIDDVPKLATLYHGTLREALGKTDDDPGTPKI